MTRQLIKFTVITVAYNAAALISRTINSVAEQDYPSIEHLIIDGNSKDKTLELVHRYIEQNSIADRKHEINCLSEPDRGIYDAMNKGLDMATGRYVLFLNAGDTLHSCTTLSEVALYIQSCNKQPAVAGGFTDIVDHHGRFLRTRRLAPDKDGLSWRDYKQGMLVCHQAFFARTDLAREHKYNLNYALSADYDWSIRLMRTAEERGLDVVVLPLTIADYLYEGATTKHHHRSLIERLKIMAKHFGWGTALASHAWFVLRLFIKK